jgi:hypothetical protein
MDTQIQQRIINTNGIFEREFLDSKTFFMYCYQQPPSMSWVTQIDMGKVLKYLKKEYATAIKDIYQYAEYNRKRRRVEFERTIIVMKDNFMVELRFDYCQILHIYEDYPRVSKLLTEVARFKKREKKNKFSIDFIIKDGDTMLLKSMDIKKTRLDLDLYYENDFKEVDVLIRKRLNQKEDKGIILLHGLPGAGKTTYLRHLVGSVRKKVMFLPPAAANHITEPGFMDLLIDNPDSVLVIEDAENIIMDRKINGSSAVSDLLNISDGLLSDFLHMQIICTFNHPLSMVDAALLRKGRLIAQYEFGRLSVRKAQRLSDKLGFTTRISRPMTIAEITHQGEKEHAPIQRVHVLGFRQHEVL